LAGLRQTRPSDAMTSVSRPVSLLVEPLQRGPGLRSSPGPRCSISQHLQNLAGFCTSDVLQDFDCPNLPKHVGVAARRSRRCTIKLWDVATGKVQKTLTGHAGLIFSVAVSPDGKIVVAGSSDKTVQL
jgi:WD40 repeat protein